MNIRLQLMKLSIEEMRLNFGVDTYKYIVIWLITRCSVIKKIKFWPWSRSKLFLIFVDKSFFRDHAKLQAKDRKEIFAWSCDDITFIY